MARKYQISPQGHNKKEKYIKVSENEKYQSRKQRSLDMLEKGIQPIKDGFNEYWIPSQNSNKRYKVTIKDGWYSCECPDNKPKRLQARKPLKWLLMALSTIPKPSRKNFGLTKTRNHTKDTLALEAKKQATTE